MTEDQKIVIEYFRFLASLTLCHPKDPGDLGLMQRRFLDRFDLKDDIRLGQDAVGRHLVYMTPLSARGQRISNLFDQEFHDLLRSVCKEEDGDDANNGSE
jgi:hypothetical protein